MLPVEILTNEHRLIEYTVGVIKKERQKISSTGKVDPNFIVTAVDFFRTFADRYHHGKEEGILFNALSKRKLSDEDAKMMRELILEHASARKLVFTLEKEKENYVGGDPEALGVILQSLDALVELYPRHIEKEDKHFFLPVMQYFTSREQEDMLNKFEEYNRTFTDHRYRQTIETLEKGI